MGLAGVGFGLPFHHLKKNSSVWTTQLHYESPFVCAASLCASCLLSRFSGSPRGVFLMVPLFSRVPLFAYGNRFTGLSEFYRDRAPRVFGPSVFLCFGSWTDTSFRLGSFQRTAFLFRVHC